MEDILYGYFEEGYVDLGYSSFGFLSHGYIQNGYITNLVDVSVQFKHPDFELVDFRKGFKYAVHDANLFQTVEYSSTKFPFYTPSKVAQLYFEAVFPQMTDLELEALRTFMFTNLPLFDTFDLVLAGQDIIYQAKFKERKLKVKQLLNNLNEVTFSFILV